VLTGFRVTRPVDWVDSLFICTVTSPTLRDHPSFQGGEMSSLPFEMAP
jgi:hypothetical protein